LPMGYVMSFARPEVRKMYKSLLDASAIMARWGTTIRACRQDIIKSGFPILRGSFTTAPFDALGDTLRGTQGIIMDMYRQPNKILEALDVITPINIANAVAAANANECPLVSIPLHKGEDNFMSRSQYEKFYWPTFRRLLTGLINEGIVPYVFAEGKYDTRLDIIKDVPKGSMVWWFERTDMAEAKKHLGGIACIAGNVPASILLTGTPQSVKEYCRKTIQVAGAGGGLILNGAAFVHDGNAENLRAMTEAAYEYGMYR
jgi:uroporphyrinogen-III decarboxylase